MSVEASVGRICPVCSGKDVQQIHSGQFVVPTGYPLLPIVEVVSCAACGFCYNDTSCTKEDYDKYYRDLSKYAAPGLSSGSGASTEDSARLAATAATILDFTKSPQSRILDIGCGAGGLLTSLAELGFTDLSGLDPSPACAAEVARCGHCGIVGTIDDFQSDSEKYSGIILSHVLEHVLDVKSALTALAGRLQPDGWLYVEVPDASRYLDCQLAPFQDFNLEHINHFSLQSLRNALTANGWNVCRAGGKTLRLERNRPYPAVFVFAHFSGECSVEFDPATHTRLIDYASVSARMLEGIDQRLRHVIADSPVAIWGAGQFTMRLLAESSLKNADIVAIIDSNPVHHGRPLHGQKIQSPDQFLRVCSPVVPIIIGSLVNLESIESSIRGRGFVNPIVQLCEAEPV